MVSDAKLADLAPAIFGRDYAELVRGRLRTHIGPMHRIRHHV